MDRGQVLLLTLLKGSFEEQPLLSREVQGSKEVGMSEGRAVGPLPPSLCAPYPAPCPPSPHIKDSNPPCLGQRPAESLRNPC